jgi:hypothetical protein
LQSNSVALSSPPPDPAKPAADGEADNWTRNRPNKLPALNSVDFSADEIANPATFCYLRGMSAIMLALDLVATIVSQPLPTLSPALFEPLRKGFL